MMRVTSQGGGATILSTLMLGTAFLAVLGAVWVGARSQWRLAWTEQIALQAEATADAGAARAWAAVVEAGSDAAAAAALMALPDDPDCRVAATGSAPPGQSPWWEADPAGRTATRVWMWRWPLVCPPLQAPQVEAHAGGGLAPDTYRVAYSYERPEGETAPSPAATVTLTSPAEHALRIQLAPPPPDALSRVYLAAGSGPFHLVAETATTLVVVDQAPDPQAPSPPAGSELPLERYAALAVVNSSDPDWPPLVRRRLAVITPQAEGAALRHVAPQQ